MISSQYKQVFKVNLIFLGLCLFLLPFESKEAHHTSPLFGQQETSSDIALFWASPYQIIDGVATKGFVNLSELLPYSEDESLTALLPDYQLDKGEDAIAMGPEQKKLMFERMKLSNKDSLYIYNFNSDRVHRFSLGELSAMAYVDLYRRGEKYLNEYDYAFGLNLEDQYDEPGNNFAYIGRENPFQTGNIQPMFWTMADPDDFPIQKPWMQQDSARLAFIMHHNDFRYHLLSFKVDQRPYYHLVFTETVTGSVISELTYARSESIFLRPIAQEDDKEAYSWTGAVFKGKAPIIYGMYSNSFGCPSVQFIDKNEPPIPIRCDNRH